MREAAHDASARGRHSELMQVKRFTADTANNRSSASFDGIQ
jgi:hypothetical protein